MSARSGLVVARECYLDYHLRKSAQAGPNVVAGGISQGFTDATSPYSAFVTSRAITKLGAHIPGLLSRREDARHSV